MNKLNVPPEEIKPRLKRAEHFINRQRLEILALLEQLRQLRKVRR